MYVTIMDFVLELNQFTSTSDHFHFALLYFVEPSSTIECAYHRPPPNLKLFFAKLSLEHARFFLGQHIKTLKHVPNNHKIYPMGTKYTKWP
jgi:hypothetical protein